MSTKRRREWRSTLHGIEGASVLMSPVILAFGGWPYLVALAVVWVLDIALAAGRYKPEPDADIRATYNVKPTPYRQKAEDPDVTHRRIMAMWPEGRRTVDGPVRLARPARRGSAAQRAVVAGWNQTGQDDLPF